MTLGLAGEATLVSSLTIASTAAVSNPNVEEVALA